ncbi:Trk2p KNAG_0C01310 [Huiozyma naganishii CBS 8797]|uniref:Potassium transport protein n=1 Tax=Huiozyma naganishii (strain ATCC MYA-139 / BCRC 22969 / CBS 8797 / KCTC 17520 / NBRC 10181 / NCYC 3082 / Yp74L-3) TaxID=1071383 RepID=J7S4D8_HUIN7|nr:hypothetical protein KNAG_0C01310 [Kazachstania naganishii CBS 8797]CCK69244.1 hypothetical protein KNAG_0C01310 [Kazachstania naganishii CBS 8797]
MAASSWGKAMWCRMWPGRRRPQGKSTWRRVRDTLHAVNTRLRPLERHLFPNFVAVHYCYIIVMSLITSVFLYPIHNYRYIDILFTATNSCTQGGLTVVQTNNLELFQQMVVYTACCLTTPIFIHGSLSFVRLYWFERYFDDIKDSSRRDFLRRRTMTLRRRQNTATRSQQRQHTTNNADDNFQENLFSGKMVSRDANNSADGTTGAARAGRGEVTPGDIYQSMRILQQRQPSVSSSSEHSFSRSSSSQRTAGSPYVVPPRYTDAGSTTDYSSTSSPSTASPSSVSPTERMPHRATLQFDIVKPPRTAQKHKGRGRRRLRHKRAAPAALLHRRGHGKRYVYDSNRIVKSHSEGAAPAPAQLNRDPSNRRTFSLPTRQQTTDTYNSNVTGNSDEELGFDIDDDLATFPDERNRRMSANYLSWQPTLGRNSMFTDLTTQQREELGGVEYRATKLLCLLVVVYYAGWHIVAFVFLLPWICTKKHYAAVVRQNGASPAWWGFFTAMSSFNDLGMTLTADSMMSFTNAVFPQIVMMWFIIIGNTGFPVLLRFIIWLLFKISPSLSATRESLGFLLDHPRRCFTLLFPRGATWWLFITLLALNITDWILFIILDFNSSFVKSLPKGIKVLIGLFQSVCTRTAGFNIVDLSKLHPSIQVSYMLMMYVSVLPLAISIRRTNVYEEQSLGVYGSAQSFTEWDNSSKKSKDEGEEDEEEEDSDARGDHFDESSEVESTASSTGRKRGKHKKPSTRSFIGAHLRRQLSFDMWFLFLGLFIICICESDNIQNTNKPDLNVFSILFEIVSAYGCVGLSLGYPDTNTSLSAEFTVISKLVIIAMLVRGRNRGLPYALDRATILPNKKLQRMDEMQNRRNPNANGEDTTVTEDPVTSYFKDKYSNYMHRWDTIKRAATRASVNKDS